ncbi:MAG TPA: CbiQ family ECF transporter T component [Nitriliruptorales bacterium]
MPELGRLHALTWAWWALCAVGVIQLAPNPTYVALVVVIAVLVVETQAEAGPFRRAFPILVAAATFFVLVRVLLTTLTTHTGVGALFTLPELTLPTILGGFTVGGSVELAVVLRSAAEGFAVVGIVAAFGGFNAVVSHHQLVRVAPRAFHELGLIVTVALAFVPSTMAAITAVRDADRARTGGRAVHRGRLLRLVVPVLESGMERAIHLAESMDARGFGHLSASRLERVAGWVAVGSLTALAGAFAALVARANVVAALLGGLGIGAMVGSIVVASRASRRPRYRTTRPTPTDAWLALVVTLAPVGVGVLVLGGEATRVWDVTSEPLPPFSLGVALPVLALAVPALHRGRAVAIEPSPEAGAG